MEIGSGLNLFKNRIKQRDLEIGDFSERNNKVGPLDLVDLIESKKSR